MIEQTLLLMAKAESGLSSNIYPTVSPFLCPKCQGSNIVQQKFQRDTRGLANSERGPPRTPGRWMRAVYRCLDCNHKWSVTGV